MSGNALPDLRVKFTDGLLRLWRIYLEFVDPTYQEGIVHSGLVTVLVQGVGSWSGTERLELTPACDRVIRIITDHLYPIMSTVHFGRFRQI